MTNCCLSAIGSCWLLFVGCLTIRACFQTITTKECRRSRSWLYNLQQVSQMDSERAKLRSVAVSNRAGLVTFLTN
ncbi:hypothetical protein QUA56_01965 [Microcoleus sp. N3A4]|uniref:hypothetical protein n=1 Tax=Microcoleus sp. N3A4 TaxID=3055379 RepID=UPI002FD2E224